MAKKGKERTQNKPKEAGRRKKADENKEGIEGHPDGFDYGGIPSRNLKKNLGC